ncbi:hypothetical protein A2331_04030 [Candidatus Falkowbacteria bacterium RIFOXYB2_FULL_34_18]|uniref:Uncharacterized protein n=1 Tax=Candidatus Falkowbacteria bacterium RIFOXYD2_FULL_34_120 TaxID=1798007 RepID=A0A1F5TSY1_9BACT|nr:MAG: hypothetical protein A2331_04030 [Candidatus Falkowbacteria bacterium RIFOXYB2_FULL_34_18]OGF29599.1 MAG: hypothetical protein A2500_06600 [Candidatus Falkowbacteria bacterium RIFOXYC12_FULL_34_55]OGF37789.1 MAG: hypothetical protein A2466_05875 [Candidatus Falkowbacteria bacterium RIFOXYC2_FULL_34_220]OGF39566.1 MAG: hypothetical protein A2515_06065 [Candidatus Falkowbacteria bacterium RIFOXYD12_FULL_34_57]OGF41894.1 MAG: hypothetical protein A2531_04290 [Candidatus Falkowbacteria bact
MKKVIKISFVVIGILFGFLFLSFVFWGGCEKNFVTYSEKGYCEFDLKSCEGIFGCKKYDDVQVLCGSVSTLCGEKVLCDCGENQVEDLTLNNFRNDQIEKTISDYFKTQKRFSWKNRDDSHNFCTIQNLKPDKELFPLYVWVYCGEYIIENNKLKTVSGSSGPVKIDYPNELSYYNINKFSYEAPRDGSNYSKDIKVIFPEDVQQKIFEHDVKDLIAKLEKNAFVSISNWNEIKRGVAECEIESVMQTHALEITATFKDDRTILAQEPKIDDIFEVINAYKDKCGEILMGTE